MNAVEIKKTDMDNNLSLELKVIERFFNKNKQERYKQFVTAEKRRSKFLKELPHFKYFENEKFMKVERHEMAIILERLKEINVLTPDKLDRFFKKVCY